MKTNVTFFFFAAFISFSGLAQGPVACYPFSGNADDVTGNNHNGTVTGATLAPDRNGNPNSAYQFVGDGTTYIDIPDFNTLGVNDEITVSMWLKATSNAGNFPMVLYPDNASDRFAISVHYSHSGTNSIFWDYGDIYHSGRAGLSVTYVSEWQHYVFTSSVSNNRMRVYEDGSLIIDKAGSDYLDDLNRVLRIGGGGGNISANYFNGFLDDIRIYNREVTAAEAMDIYQGAGACTDDHLSVASNTLSAVQLKAYPNPSADVINLDFQLAGNTPVQVTITDLLGKLITVQELNGAAGSNTWNWDTKSVNGTSVTSGTYICQVNVGNTSRVIRLNVQR